MNTVSFETAKALRDAGFPQPEPAEGQFWYIGNSLYGCFWDEITNTRYILFAPGMSIDFNMVRGLIFAPQAHDILAELESDFDISCLQDKTWMVICRNAADQPIGYFTEPNPHEAAAKAYLQLHKPA